MTNIGFWEFVRGTLGADEPLLLLLVVESQGSSPGKPGFKMAVTAGGRIQGTIGGGAHREGTRRAGRRAAGPGNGTAAAGEAAAPRGRDRRGQALRRDLLGMAARGPAAAGRRRQRRRRLAALRPEAQPPRPAAVFAGRHGIPAA